MRRLLAALFVAVALAFAGASVALAGPLSCTSSGICFTRNAIGFPQSSNGTLNWGLLGVNNAFVASGATATSANGVAATITFGVLGATGSTWVQCALLTCTGAEDWTGNFNVGENLLTNIDFTGFTSARNINLTFGQDLSSVGFTMMANPYGTFSVQIGVYDGSTLLATFDSAGLSESGKNTANFYGVYDMSGFAGDITSIKIAGYNCGGGSADFSPSCTDSTFPGFAIGTLVLSTSSTPEPTSLALLGSGLALLGFVRRKLAARK